MSERVAVYIDFDNVVISRYDDVHGKGAWRKDDPREHQPSAKSTNAIDQKLAEAQIDIGAIIDYAASFGTVSLSRAYADWSVPANAAYRSDLTARALHLVQLFSVSGAKNGARAELQATRPRRRRHRRGWVDEPGSAVRVHRLHRLRRPARGFPAHDPQTGGEIACQAGRQQEGCGSAGSVLRRPDGRRGRRRRHRPARACDPSRPAEERR